MLPMSISKELESWQRAWLRKQAHDLDPVVHIGVSGLSPAVEKAFVEALACHELVKIRFVQSKEEKKTMSLYLAGQTQSQLVAVIGNTAIFWKPSKDPDKQQIRLPSREAAKKSSRF